MGHSSDCASEAHIDCNYSKEKKIPMKELLYMNGQREKMRIVEPHQMELVEILEHRRQTPVIQTQEERREAEERMK